MFRFALVRTGNGTHNVGWSRRRRGIPIVAVLTGSVVLAACGSSTAPSVHVARPTTQATGTVERVDSSVTAQMVAAAVHGSSTSHEATFTLTAHTASGAPAANQPVAFWVGPMTPLSGVHPAHWYQAGQTSAHPYVASYTSTTDAGGRARIVLLGQPAKSMEMVAVKIGALDSYDMAAGHGLGLLDAWWTAPGTTRTAPVGDTVAVSPFLETTHPGQSTVFHVKVADAAGKPIVGAGVDFIPQKLMGTISGGTSTSATSGMGTSGTGTSGTSGMGTSGTSGTSGMGTSGTSGTSGMAPLMALTDSAGTAAYSFQRPENGSMCALRIVVTQPASTLRIAGGMAGELLTPG